MLQGRRIGVSEGDSIAVLCIDKPTGVVHGIAYYQSPGSDVQPLVQCVNHVAFVPIYALLKNLFRFE